MPKKLQITRMIVAKTVEIDYNEENYPGMTIEQAIAYEQNLSEYEIWDALTISVEADGITATSTVIVIEDDTTVT